MGSSSEMPVGVFFSVGCWLLARCRQQLACDLLPDITSISLLNRWWRCLGVGRRRHTPRVQTGHWTLHGRLVSRTIKKAGRCACLLAAAISAHQLLTSHVPNGSTLQVEGIFANRLVTTGLTAPSTAKCFFLTSTRLERTRV